jgi:glucosamine 6-phosphate synthetase-like amidotransferase/phosphosugar isomerase protein
VPGCLTSLTIAAQPGWLRALRVEERLPEGARVLFTGCGTSYHAALAAGSAVHALDAVLGDAPPADVLVAISHEGETKLTLEVAVAFGGETWATTGVLGSPIANVCDHVVVATPEVEKSYCHTASYVCAVAAGRALRGEDVSGLATEVEQALAVPAPAASGHERWLLVGAGRDWPTALEATLKLREGAHVAAEAHQTEQLLHGHLAAIDDSVRAFVLQGEGRAAQRAHDAVAALSELGCDVTLVPTSEPVADIVQFQRLAVALADARGVDPDMIRWDEQPWDRARKAT